MVVELEVVTAGDGDDNHGENNGESDKRWE